MHIIIRHKRFSYGFGRCVIFSHYFLQARKHLSFAEGLMRVAVDAAFSTTSPDDYRVSGVIESRPATEGTDIFCNV